MLISRPPQQGEIFIIQFYLESDTCAPEEIEKLNSRLAEHTRCFAGRNPFAGVKLKCGLFSDGAHQFHCGTVIDGTVGNQSRRSVSTAYASRFLFYPSVDDFVSCPEHR